MLFSLCSRSTLVDPQPEMHGHTSLGMSQFSSHALSSVQKGTKVAKKLLRQEEHTAVY